MKRLLIYTFLLSLICLPAFAGEKDLHLQNIFISFVPQDEELNVDLIPLKGYAEFMEGSDEIDLVNSSDEYILNLKVPQKIQSKRLIDLKKQVVKRNTMQMLERNNNPEYSISSQGNTTVEKAGDFMFGTIYNSSIDTSQLEYSTGLFTRYEKNRFAISTSYKKTLLSTYGAQTDKFYIAPEIRLNKIFAISEVMSADITRNRKAHELVLIVNPMGNKDKDRMKFELGAGQTYDDTNAIIRSQVRFNTTFKL